MLLENEAGTVLRLSWGLLRRMKSRGWETNDATKKENEVREQKKKPKTLAQFLLPLSRKKGILGQVRRQLRSALVTVTREFKF